MKLSDYFDKIFIIGSLNTQRVNNTIDSLKKLDLYDENVLVHLYSPLSEVGVKMTMPCDERMNIHDRLSLALAHYTIIRHSYDAGLNSVLILEDDNFFLNDKSEWENILSNIPKDWDEIKFSGFVFADKHKPLEMFPDLVYNGLFRKIDPCRDMRERWGWSASMIAYNRKSMELYLTNQQKIFHVADEVDGLHSFYNCERQDVNIYMPMVALAVPFNDLYKYGCSWYVKYDKTKFINAIIKTALCCIIKSENRYIREFVEHYKKIGFDHIFIYDNNDYDGENPEDVISDYVDSGFVSIIQKYKGVQNINIQSQVYNECFEEHKWEYDWMAFFDADEFLMLDDKYKTISDVLSLSQYCSYDAIHVCWRNYGDNNIIEVKDNDYSLVNRFTSLSFNQDDSQIKSIVKCKTIKNVYDIHNGNREFDSCNSNGEKSIISGNFGEYTSNPSYANMWLNHYRTKSLQEYIEIKLLNKKLWREYDYRHNINYYFLFNVKTPEKLEYIEKYLNNNKN